MKWKTKDSISLLLIIPRIVISFLGGSEHCTCAETSTVTRVIADNVVNHFQSALIGGCPSGFCIPGHHSGIHPPLVLTVS